MTNERIMTPGEMRTVAVVNDAASAAWQSKTTIAVVLVVINGEYHGAFISTLRPDERSTPLPAGRVRVAVTPSTALLITAAIRSGQPVPEEVVLQSEGEE